MNKDKLENLFYNYKFTILGVSSNGTQDRSKIDKLAQRNQF